MKRILLMAMMACVTATTVLAQDVKVEADISDKVTALGDALRYTLTIDGSQDVDPPPIPAIDGLDIRYVGPSTRISIVNGRYSSSVAHAYSIFPIKTGVYRIPSLDVIVDGKTLQTLPIDFEVTASAPASAPSSVGSAPNDPQAAADLRDKMFVTLQAPERDVYVNEAVPVTITLFVSPDIAVSEVQLPQWPDGAFGKSDVQYRQVEKVIDGVRYATVEFNTVIYPAREGELILGPASVPFNVVVQNRNNDPFGGGSFGDSFFNSFFANRERRTVSLSSQALALNVKPIPQEGRPADFTGAVGQFNFEASAGPEDVQVGDPLTVRMNISGSGSLSAVEFPSIKESADFKVYEPSKQSDKSARSLEQVVIPVSENVKEFPALSFSWFDPSDGQYHTIIQGPFPLKVKPASQKSQPPFASAVSPAAIASAEPEPLGEDIVFIKEGPGYLRPVGARVYRSKKFHFGLAAYTVFWLAAMLGLMFFRRIQTDVRFANRLKSADTARKGLAELRRSVNDPFAFYDRAHTLLIEYFSLKLGLPPGAIDAPVIQEHVRGKGHETIAAPLREVFAECESARFAGGSGDPAHARECLKKIETILRYMKKEA